MFPSRSPPNHNNQNHLQEIGFVPSKHLRYNGRRLPMVSGIIVFAHGSRIEPANQAVRAVAADLARAGNFAHVEAAFLELDQPPLAGAVTILLSKGVARIVVIPYFLTLGMHLER